eukprot:TRINITY_DN9568_c0_g1_i2.p1 TRINITY_DN9568_c0_g1~~TRINITY_DN9568_c0_g1_i2.p1  ORF type:complete len:133 (+),score=14.09 TRINITY_DN9568_c0_g1_i2:22-420(+)
MSAFDKTLDTTLMGAGVGAAYGAIAAAWRAKPVVAERTAPLLLDTAGIIARNAGIIAGSAAVYQLTKSTVATARGGEDAVSNGLGGCAAGALAAFRAGAPAALGSCLFFGTAAALAPRVQKEILGQSQTQTH